MPSAALSDDVATSDALTWWFSGPALPGPVNGFPPTGPTVLTGTIPAYLYEEYQDDENLQAFFAAYNILVQRYVTWFATVALPIYPGLFGALLDWICNNLYGQARPQLSYGTLEEVGPLNTWTPNEVSPNDDFLAGNPVLFSVADDFYKRVLTWNFFKGDGKEFSVRWLKRRIYRFLYGINGTAPNVVQTYQISVSIVGTQINVVIVQATFSTILDAEPNNFELNQVTPNECDLSITPLMPVPWATVLQALFLNGWLELPFQYTYTFTVLTGVPPANYLTNASGVLNVSAPADYPTSAVGLNPGDIWSNSDVISVVPGLIPDPAAAPVYFPGVTDVALLAIGGGNLPLAAGAAGSGLLWNNNNVVNVS